MEKCDILTEKRKRREQIQAIWQQGKRMGSETLGTDATNPAWIKSGRAVPCEFGIYPLTEDEMKEIEKV